MVRGSDAAVTRRSLQQWTRLLNAALMRRHVAVQCHSVQSIDGILVYFCDILRFLRCIRLL